MNHNFPDDFIWGAATASFQIEGAAYGFGKLPSIWDTFSHTPGNVANGDTGDFACDHYNRFVQDIAIMKELGIKAYRFSISWPRVMKDAKNTPNPQGIEFYKKLTDELIKNDIKPVATLYHWDLPQILQDEGGWANRKTAEYFVNFADLMFRELDGRVYQWITFNEPSVFIFLGNLDGVHAPGMKDIWTSAKCVHNVLWAHGSAVKIFREKGYKGQIGITLNLAPYEPASSEINDVMAASTGDAQWNRLFLDPIFKGTYPEIIMNNPEFRKVLGTLDSHEMEVISEKIDFLGINYYFRNVVKYSQKGKLGFESVKMDGEKTYFGWEVYPQGLYDILRYIKENYGNIPLYITENGATYDDILTSDRKIHDVQRISYLKRHFEKALLAIQDGINLKGYYVWSLLDNFEWAEGYSKRFGLVYIDYKTFERIPKDSFLWYKKVIEENTFEV